MPYALSEDLPPAIKRSLPSHAQDIFRSVFNSAWAGYGQNAPGRREEMAHRVAWAAVEKRYRKLQGGWEPIAG